MGQRILKIFHLAAMTLALVALIVFMILQVSAGLDTQMSKLYFGLYCLLILWAGARVFTLIKELRNK